MRVLLALSADGSAVTPVEEYGYRKLPTAAVEGAADTIDGANRGRAISYRSYGSKGIHYYQGPSSPPEERGSLNMDVAGSAGDGTQVMRGYVAGRHDLYTPSIHGAAEGDWKCQAGRGCRRRCVNSAPTTPASMPRPIVSWWRWKRRASTANPHGEIPVLHVTDYRASLPDGPLRSAPLSGMAIGPRRVYLTLLGATYVVSVAKPRL